MTHALRSLTIAAALLLIPASLVRAEEGAEGEEPGGEAAHGGHHGGPLHFSDVLHNPEMWTAALNFTLLVLLLTRFGRAPIASFLQGRRKAMEEAINEAAVAKAAAELKLKEYNDRLAQLDGELAKLRADIVAAGEEDKRRIVADAEEMARRTKRETDALVDQYTKQLNAQVRAEMVDAAIVAAEALVRQKLSPADQQRLADAFRQRLAQGPAAGKGAVS